jgi:hypothetical protein
VVKQSILASEELWSPYLRGRLKMRPETFGEGFPVSRNTSVPFAPGPVRTMMSFEEFELELTLVANKRMSI